MRKEECLIWWTSQDNYETMEGMDRDHWPEELAIEYRSREGRNGRGRLWVPHQWMNNPDMKIEWKNSDPMFKALGDNYGGIVFRRDFYPLISNLPGLFTDFDMNVISGTWEVRRPSPNYGYFTRSFTPGIELV